MSAIPITIVLPVYNGLDDVGPCLRSVLAHTVTGPTAPVELLVIDDASPDPAIGPLLADVTAGADPERLPVQIRTHDQNLGFVATVNEGMRAAPGDVVLLNADTVVTAGWLERLRDLAAAPEAGTVTPLTNFGSLATLPRPLIDAFALDGDEPRIDECGAFVAAHGTGAPVEVISGVGFCLYLTRAAIDAAGPFDEATFGRGYGEEVDFCLRAGRLGFRHLIADTAFVFHRGGVSFAGERDERMAAASRLLHKRYPFFRAANAAERDEAPLALSFLALELGLTDRDPDRPHVLQILHGPPDSMGHQKHLDVDGALDHGGTSVLFPSSRGSCCRRGGRSPTPSGTGSVPGRRGSPPHGDRRGPAHRARPVPFDVAHPQPDRTCAVGGARGLRRRGRVLDPPLPGVPALLLYRNRQPCGIPEDLAVCGRCLPETRGLTQADLDAFRGEVTRHLDVVDHWVGASRSAADYLLRAYPVDPARVRLIPHGTIVDPNRRRVVDETLVLDEPLRLAFVGRGWAKKGLDLVNELADDLAETTIELHHFGGLVDEASPHVHLHGPYDNEVLPDLLHRAGIQIVILPGMYAETFGFVLTESLIAGIPVIGAGYGALGERIRTLGAGWTIDTTDPASVRELVLALDAARFEVLRATECAVAASFESVAATAPRYAALYRSSGTDPFALPPESTPTRSADAR
jgi:GT2 family glycosyltransferase/glycosyltransferase involved in cell wall biosynthesis